MLCDTSTNEIEIGELCNLGQLTVASQKKYRPSPFTDIAENNARKPMFPPTSSACVSEATLRWSEKTSA
ncbi:hypothetical protein M404DRAFT_1008049 [Pisolithus tinctorius Marx 270]|uniref:Uncharacterized protein n=1 Tax=Pisolithus tinctorius Marx 270 TaxID=870435 RepID=A0A0C3N0Y4_PISTI|nr:hypothetical protein M404DRAFT_1008049 [Pisolithus tinctorius Marx 270]